MIASLLTKIESLSFHNQCDPQAPQLNVCMQLQFSKNFVKMNNGELVHGWKKNHIFIYLFIHGYIIYLKLSKYLSFIHKSTEFFTIATERCGNIF